MGQRKRTATKLPCSAHSTYFVFESRRAIKETISPVMRTENMCFLKKSNFHVLANKMNGLNNAIISTFLNNLPFSAATVHRRTIT